MFKNLTNARQEIFKFEWDDQFNINNKSQTVPKTSVNCGEIVKGTWRAALVRGK